MHLRRAEILTTPLVIVALVGALVLSVLRMKKYWFTIDDAYISMRYAINWVDGDGLVYNLGERVEGYTNFLWVAYLALCRLLGLNLPQAANWLGIIATCASLILLTHIWVRCFPKQWWLTILLILGFAHARIVNVWATGGLETSFFAFLVIASLYPFFVFRSEKKQVITSAILCLALTLTRPEGLMFSGILLIALYLAQRKKTDASSLERSLLPRNVTLWLLIYTLPLAFYLAWKLFYYGDIVPNTFYSKVWDGELYMRGYLFFLSFGLDHLFFWWAPALLLLLWNRDWRVRCALFQLLLYVLYTILIGGDWMEYRFYNHVFPLLWLLTGIFAHWAITHYQPTGTKIFAPVSTLFSLCVVLVAAYGFCRPMWNEPWGPDNLFGKAIMIQPAPNHLDEWFAVEVAKAYDKLLEPDDVVAASFAGFSGVYTKQTVIDMYGQTDAHIARDVHHATWRMPGHEKFDGQYILDRKPVCLYPWPSKNPQPGTLSLEYEPGKYLSCRPGHYTTEQLIKRFSKKALRIFNDEKEVLVTPEAPPQGEAPPPRPLS